MEQQIREAIALFRRSDGLQDHELYETLVLGGTDKRMAARLVEFLPMVYCRIVFQGSAQFADTYQRVLPTGDHTEMRELSSEPVWNAVMAYGRKEVESGITEQQILAVAEHGSEYQVATELIRNGSKLEEIRFTPARFLWPEDGPSLATAVGSAGRDSGPFASSSAPHFDGADEVIAAQEFAQALDGFVRFIVRQGYPSRLLWVGPGDVVFWRRRCFVWAGDQAHRFVTEEQHFMEALRRSCGVELYAQGQAAGRTVCHLIVPRDEEDAQRRLIPATGVKMSAAIDPPSVFLVRSRVWWALMKRLGIACPAWTD